MKRINVGVVGCGNISGIYFENLTHTFLNTNVCACADINAEAAKAAAEKWGVRAMTVDELMGCGEIEIVLNITTPGSHFSVCRQALESGKHVYVEKPLSLELGDGLALLRLAKEKGLLLGGAPDTFLGAGIQTCRKLIDNDFIGRPVAAAAFMMCHGHESWHPSPEFYYKKGGGPMFDMGPYYLTALVTLIGQVGEVSGMASTSFPERTITSAPKSGTVVKVEVPTHVCGLLRFENGAVGTVITSFDTWNSTLPRIEIYGTKGTLIVPDPNSFGGPVLLATLDGSGFKEIPLTHGCAENARGIGVADMAACIQDGRAGHRASGELCAHVLEIMCGLHISNGQKQLYEMRTKYTGSRPLDGSLAKGTI